MSSFLVVPFLAVTSGIVGLGIGSYDEALVLHLIIGSLLAPIFFGVVMFLNYKCAKRANPLIGIDIFQEHLVLHDPYHVFHIPLKNIRIKIEPTLHLKFKNSGTIFIFSDGKCYVLQMSKDLQKFQNTLNQLNINSSIYQISSIATCVLVFSLMIIFPELDKRIGNLLVISAMIFLGFRHLRWSLVSENKKQFKQKFKEDRLLFRFSCIIFLLCCFANCLPLSLQTWKYFYVEYLMSQQKYESGLAMLDEMVKSEPKAIYLNSYAWFLTAAKDNKVRDYAKAIHLAQVALEKSPNSVMIADTLACAYLGSGEKKRALELAANYKLDKRVQEFQTGTLCLENDELTYQIRNLASQTEKK